MGRRVGGGTDRGERYEGGFVGGREKKLFPFWY